MNLPRISSRKPARYGYTIPCDEWRLCTPTRVDNCHSWEWSREQDRRHDADIGQELLGKWDPVVHSRISIIYIITYHLYLRVIYIYLFTYHIYTYIRMYIYTYIYIYIYIYIFIYSYTHIVLYSYIHIFIYSYIPTLLHSYITLV